MSDRFSIEQIGMIHLYIVTPHYHLRRSRSSVLAHLDRRDIANALPKTPVSLTTLSMISFDRKPFRQLKHHGQRCRVRSQRRIAVDGDCWDRGRCQRRYLSLLSRRSTSVASTTIATTIEFSNATSATTRPMSRDWTIACHRRRRRRIDRPRRRSRSLGFLSDCHLRQYRRAAYRRRMRGVRLVDGSPVAERVRVREGARELRVALVQQRSEARVRRWRDERVSCLMYRSRWRCRTR